MEKIAIIGDPHFGRKAEHPIIKKYVKEGQDAFYDFLIEKLNIEAVSFFNMK